MEKEKKYLISVNYSNEKTSFQEIIKSYIENLLKQPVRGWNLQGFDVKYK